VICKIYSIIEDTLIKYSVYTVCKFREQSRFKYIRLSSELQN